MAQQLKIGYIGIKKQASKGAAGATPATFGHGLLSGKVLNVPLDQPTDDLTVSGTAGAMRVSPTVYRNAAYANWGFKTRAYPATLGLYLFAAAGTDTPNGPGPYNHVITPGATLPYLTFFGRAGNVPLNTLTSDCKIDTATVSWTARAPLELDIVAQGISPNPTAAAFTITNDEVANTYFTPPNALANYQLDVASGTPAAAKVTAFSFTIANNIVPVDISATMTPDDVFEGQQVISGTVSIIPADYTDWVKAVTGTGAGTAPSTTPPVGSLNLLVAIDASNQLTFNSTAVRFSPDLPDSNATGGPMQVDLPFVCVGTAPYTITVRNNTPTY